VRARLVWVAAAAAAVGGVAAGRLLRKRTSRADADPADDLRRKLDESRALDAEREEFELGETPVDQAEAPAESLEERRRRVHERAQAVAEEMRSEPDGEPDSR
jgi:hypothetical protein